MELKKVNVGDRLSMTYYLEVLGTTPEGLKVRDQNGVSFEIRGKDLIEKTIQSANQYTKTQKVSRTELVNTLLNAKDSVFSCTFNKVDGKERTLIGHLTDTETHFGRSNVIDLENTSGSPIRQVDHRTLSEVIINNTKYSLNK